jgi:hypothetical protein
VIYGLSFDGGDGYPFGVSGTGWAEKDEHQTGTSGSGDVSGCFGSKDLASQGSSGSATVSCSVSDGGAYFQLAIAPGVTQAIGTVRPNGDVTAQWEASTGGSHYVLIDEVTLDTSDYIYTSSLTSGNVADEFNATTLDIQSGNVKEIQVKVFGVDSETGIDSSINVYCGSWLGIKPLNMESGEGWYTYSWSGLNLPQADLDGMKIKFGSEQPTAGGIIQENFDYVQFGDVLDDTLGSSNDEFVITGWLYPTNLASNQSSNGIKNVFFAKDGNIEIGVNESGFLQLYLNTNSIEATGTYGFANAISLNQWSYIAIRYNQSDVDVLIGEIWCREALGGTLEPWDGGGTLQTGGSLTIGAETASFASFTGILDEISVFNASLTDSQVETHMGNPIVSISPGVSKEDGTGGWTLITTPGEIIDDYLNFEVNATGNEVESMEFYLSNIEPNFQTQTEADWDLLASFNYDSSYYSYLLNSRDLPDNDSWYFISKATDISDNTVYDFYNVYFAIEHFHDLVNYTYIDQGGRINHNSHIGVVPIEGFEWHISSLNVFVNLSNDIDCIKSVSYNDLYSYYWLIDLVELQNWALNKGLSPDNYLVNFVIEANFSYSFGKPFYLYNYSLDNITLDVKGPDIELLTGGAYSLSLGSTYDVIENNLITMGINSTDSDFEKISLEYKYTTPTTADWIVYGDFEADNSLAELIFDVVNLRDDNITIRFIGYDSLLNSKTLYEANYWFVKDFNNHENFVVQGIESGTIYGLDQDNMVDLNVKILPVDNDITKVRISTGYETFELNNVESEENHIYFTDDGVVDIKLNSSKYPISGSDFTFIDVSVVLYQGNDRITDKDTTITVIARTFNDAVEISDLLINISSLINNIRMSFVNGTNAYNNSDSIPFIVNNMPPIVKIFNSYGDLVQTIDLNANFDYLSSVNFTEVEIVGNKFTVAIPNLPAGDEICSIELLKVNGSSYEFSYFIDAINENVLFTLLTQQDLDGVYDSLSPIFMDIGVSNRTHSSDQFIASFDFSQLTQDNYTFVGEFCDITGVISQFTINSSISIDFHGPQIYSQFTNNCSINPESGSISFVVNDLSGVSQYYFNTTIDGYWTVVGNLYTFTFTDSIMSGGTKFITFTCNDTLGLETEYQFLITIDKFEPEFSNVETLSSYWTDLFGINATITDTSGFTLSVEALHLLSGEIAYNLDYTITRRDGKWVILIYSEGLQNGYYNLTLIATDSAGNIGTYVIESVYLDAQFSEIESIEEEVIADNENVYNNTITDTIYFNDEKYLEISAFDELFDGFDWSQIDPIIADQLGVKNISFCYTNPLSWYNISVLGALDYETLHYRITGYGNPINYDIMNVKNIQSLKIGDYYIDKFTVLLDGTSLTVKIDEQYRYLLSPFLTDQIYAQFYELVADKIFLSFNNDTKKWELLSPEKDYFNVSDYLSLTEGQEFLFWFETQDGLGNELLSHKLYGVYDNVIENSPQEESLFEWSLGTNSNEAGIFVFGSDFYSDSTIQLNVSSVLPTVSGECDVVRIMIYGSEDNITWTYVGRAYFSGEDNLWTYYWDGDQLDPMLPENYSLKIYAFDRAGNYLSQTHVARLYDYTQVVLLTDVIFGQVFGYNASLISNPQNIEGVIDNYFEGSSESLWDVIAEFYDPNLRDWVPLAYNASTIIANGDSATYTITWDISKDLSFVKSMYDYNYEYLPLRINEATSSDLWGSWGLFSGGSQNWQPVVISESSGYLDISAFEFNDVTGWELDISSSVESTINSIEGQVFTLFDVNKDNKFEIIRVSSSQIDVIYLDYDDIWQVRENVTDLSGYNYFGFDLEYDVSTSEANMVVIQADEEETLSLWKYKFDGNYDLVYLEDCESPVNFEPATVKIANYFSASDRKAILIGGLIYNSHLSQLFEFDSNLNFKNVLVESLLGKISIIEYDSFNGKDTILLGVERLSIGKMDAVVAFKRAEGTEDWKEFELSGFDETKFEILDFLTIQENNLKKLIISSKTGLYQTSIKYLKQTDSITSPICFTHEVYSKQDLAPDYYPIITLKHNPIYSINKISYKLSGDSNWYELDYNSYRISRTEIQVDLAAIWSTLAFLKVAYSFESFKQEERTGSVSKLELTTKWYDLSTPTSYFWFGKYGFLPYYKKRLEQRVGFRVHLDARTRKFLNILRRFLRFWNIIRKFKW